MSIARKAQFVTHDLEADLTGAAVAAAILAAEHLALYDRRDELHPTARYALGVIGIGIGHTLACALQGDVRGALRFWLVAGAGGAAVLAGYAARGELPGERLDWVTRGFHRLMEQ
jgi:hypothetical protein